MRLRDLRNPDCDLCPLHKTASRVCVMGDGLYKLPVFVVGEAPGSSEDRVGRPFVGAAGKLLRAELRNSGLNPQRLYLTNAAKCYPNGTPTDDEAALCASVYLAREIQSLSPLLILAVGGTALKALTFETKVGEARGQIHDCRYSDALVFSTYHPAYCLYNRAKLPTFKEDLVTFATLVRLECGGKAGLARTAQ